VEKITDGVKSSKQLPQFDAPRNLRCIDTDSRLTCGDNEISPVAVDVNSTATLDQMASGDCRAAPVRKAKWHLGEYLQLKTWLQLVSLTSCCW